MQQSDFSFFQRFILEEAGILLDDSKTYLVESRLKKILLEEGLGSLEELIRKINQDTTRKYHQRIINALTTTESFFFRDPNVFKLITSIILPSLIEARRDECSLNIWSCGCSSGQEAFSLGMTIRENFPDLENWELNLLASDINTEMLRKASAALFTRIDLGRGLDAERIKRYFIENGETFALIYPIRRMVRFEHINLVKAWPVTPPFDLVLLRHVLMYFDESIRKRIVRKVRQRLAPGGVVLVGGTESISDWEPELRIVRTPLGNFYRLNDGPSQ